MPVVADLQGDILNRAASGMSREEARSLRLTRKPGLATYMGHKSLVGTQRYLRLTPEIFPDIIARLEKFVGYVIPRRVDK